MCMSFVAVGRSLTIVSYVAFKMAALWFWTMPPSLWGGGILVDHWSTISSLWLLGILDAGLMNFDNVCENCDHIHGWLGCLPVLQLGWVMPRSIWFTILTTYTPYHCPCLCHCFCICSVLLSQPGMPGWLYSILYWFVWPPPLATDFVHAITTEQLFLFLSFLAWSMALTYRLPD